MSTKIPCASVIHGFLWLVLALMLLITFVPNTTIFAIDLKGWLFIIGSTILAALSYIIRLLERLVQEKEAAVPSPPSLGASTYKE